MPDCEFVLLIRTIADSEVYARMRSYGLYVGRLGELESVLGAGIDPARYEGREEAYLLRRLKPNPYVENVERCGQVAFHVIRRRGLRPLTIVTFEAYELTADAAYQLLEEHPDISLDAMVSTNPRCNGFAPSVLEVTSNTNVKLVSLRDFLRRLGDTWDETD